MNILLTVHSYSSAHSWKSHRLMVKTISHRFICGNYSSHHHEIIREPINLWHALGSPGYSVKWGRTASAAQKTGLSKGNGTAFSWAMKLRNTEATFLPRTPAKQMQEQWQMCPENRALETGTAPSQNITNASVLCNHEPLLILIHRWKKHLSTSMQGGKSIKNVLRTGKIKQGQKYFDYSLLLLFCLRL